MWWFIGTSAAAGIVFALVVRAGRREWASGDELSRSTALLINAAWLLALAMFAIAIVWRPLPFAREWPVLLGGALLVAIGAALAIPGYRPFASVRQLYGLDRGDVLTGGAYRFSRHPQYTGIALALAGGALLAGSGLAVVVVGAYVAAMIPWTRVEESHLVSTFGKRYASYRAQAPRFLGLPGV